MISFGAFKLIVIEPTVVTRQRTWGERLFTRPWKPLQKTSVFVQKAWVPEDECIIDRTNSVIYCGPTYYKKLKDQLGKQYALSDWVNHGAFAR